MFITFEGIEGSGKSTLLEALAQRLRENGSDVLVTKEPGGTPAGDAIRALLLGSDLDMTPLTEALLMNASRSQLVARSIRPALAEERVVLCDRYADSSIAYQGYGRGLDIPMLRLLCLAATGGLEPQLTLLLDLPYEASRARLAGRAADRFEREDEAFFDRVRHGYLEMAKSAERWHVLDATQSPEALLDEAWQIVRERVEAPA
jgi:dTMP kinase